jgi:hypothetical protein
MKSGTCRELIGRLAAIEEYIRTEKPRKPVGDDIWLDNDAVCVWLKISRRTLQRYRSTGTLSYSLIGRKTYYRAAEIKRLLEKTRVKRGDGSPEEQSAHGSETSSKE